MTNDGGLFLLEVLIDKVSFLKSPCFSDKDFRTCVTVAAPSVEPLEICDDDPGQCPAKSGGPFVKMFNSGKSCLFSLKDQDIVKAMSRFPIEVTVYKSLPCGCLPTKIIMGQATIDMTKEFVQSRSNYLEDPENVSCQALKDSFQIIAPEGGSTGPHTLGADRGPAIVDRSCNPPREHQTSNDPCVCGAARVAGVGKGVPGTGPPCQHGGGGGSGAGPCPIAQDPFNSKPCEDPDDICYCSGPKPPPNLPMGCRNMDQHGLPAPKDCCPTGNKVIFQMPSDTCNMNHKQRAHFNFTSEGVGDVSRDDPGQLVPTTAEDYPGVVYDFPHQVIKLRVRKVIEQPGRKSKFDYQFITPAVPQRKAIPVIETRTVQCLPTCPYGCPSQSTKRKV